VELYLQFGHGMMGLVEELLRKWNGGTVILSPRDLKESQLVKMANKARNAGGEALLDPQCFLRDSDHHRLTKHEYWQTYNNCSTSNILTGNGARDLLKKLGELDRRLKLERHILPGLLATQIDDDWLTFHEQMIQAGQKEFPGEALLVTVALSAEAIRDESQVETLIERAATWPVAGFYVVAEAPSQYLVDDPVWLANVLILASGLKLLGKSVIVGYANHQLLCLAAGNIDAMASGNWLNVRAFPIKKFYEPPEDEQLRKATWYYCPQALSEYKLAYLDIAMRNGVLDEMRPDPPLDPTYAASLFAGAQPAAVGWKEPQAFRHYLTSLRGQCQQSTAGSFDDAVTKHKALLDAAKPVLKTLDDNGVFADYRSFEPILNVNRSALITLDRARGPRLRREWK